MGPRMADCGGMGPRMADTEFCMGPGDHEWRKTSASLISIGRRGRTETIGGHGMDAYTCAVARRADGDCG